MSQTLKQSIWQTFLKNKFVFIAGLAAAGFYYAKVKELELLARTIYGEARGEGAAGMAAVAHSIVNRAKSKRWYGGTITQVILRSFQYSVWNDPKSANYKATIAADENDPVFLEAMQIAKNVLNGDISDLTRGATHYHTIAINPAWADQDKVTLRLGKHVFYKGIN